MSRPTAAGETVRATGFARHVERIADLLVDRIDIVALGELVVRAAVESCGAGAAALVLDVAGRPQVVATGGAVPMSARGEVMGALSYYSSGDPDRADQNLLRALADSTGALLARARVARRGTILTAHLRQALDDRVVVQRAVGVPAGT